MTTEELDVIVHEECINNKCYPSPLLYRGFPKSVCTSVNNVACHGIPDSRPLEDGDIINVDVTVSIKDLLTLVLLNPNISCFANSVDPDQLASEEAN